MEERILDRFERYHLIGIGGISMSALAKLLILCGKKVSGSERSPRIRLTAERCSIWNCTAARRPEHLAEMEMSTGM